MLLGHLFSKIKRILNLFFNMLIKLFSIWDVIWMIIVEDGWLIPYTSYIGYTNIFKDSRQWHVSSSPAIIKLGRLDRNSHRDVLGIELVRQFHKITA